MVAKQLVLRLLAAYTEVEDLIQIGAYARGSSAETDVAIDYYPRIVELLTQGRGEEQPFDQSRVHLIRLAMEASDAMAKHSQPPRG